MTVSFLCFRDLLIFHFLYFLRSGSPTSRSTTRAAIAMTASPKERSDSIRRTSSSYVDFPLRPVV